MKNREITNRNREMYNIMAGNALLLPLNVQKEILVVNCNSTKNFPKCDFIIISFTATGFTIFIIIISYSYNSSLDLSFFLFFFFFVFFFLSVDILLFSLIVGF